MSSPLPFISLSDLETKAWAQLCSQMAPFSPKPPFRDIFSCPWLRVLTALRGKLKGGSKFGEGNEIEVSLIRGLLLLQDWGCEPQTLKDAIDELKGYITGTTGSKPGTDRTLNRLLGRKGWKRAITSGEWLVSNAVWGLRKGSKTSGYLGDTIHKAAFPIWLELVSLLSRGKKDFRLIVAGSWAIFDDEFCNKNREGLPIRDYLNLWRDWLKCSGQEIQELIDQCEGTVHRVNHPSTWNPCPDYKIFEGGPDGDI